MPEIKEIFLAVGEKESALPEKAAKMLGVSKSELASFKILRKSLDSRKRGAPKWVYSVEALLPGEKPAGFVYQIPELKSAERPVVAGFGPAGMFAALALARAGLRPIVLERGRDAQTRKKDVEAFWESGRLDKNSNVQFGEGGAGAFSDGKLNTGTKNPRISFVLSELRRFGAQENITYDARPHVGTDVLLKVVTALRSEITALGGEVRFESVLTGLEGERELSAARVECGGGEYLLPCRSLILAPGHSARDSFEALCRRGLPMEAKSFSLGARIEHRQSMVSERQHGPLWKKLPPADYRLACHLREGSVYTFCMCPGGFVVAAASEEGGVVTNGMSYSGRAGENANSALLVSVTPAMFPGASPLSGMYWQREIERAAFACAGGDYRAPAQTVGDFLKNVPGEGPRGVAPTYRPGVRWGDMRAFLPECVTSAMAAALPALDAKLRGFADADAVLTGPETRSSSPVRLLRGENMMSTGLRGLFPCGEGAGYAGGIVSAAVDGLLAAEAVMRKTREE